MGLFEYGTGTNYGQYDMEDYFVFKKEDPDYEYTKPDNWDPRQLEFNFNVVV